MTGWSSRNNVSALLLLQLTGAWTLAGLPSSLLLLTLTST